MLYVVGTPIGNLGDITSRAIEILTSVDYIACEDTRTSGVLLKHYGITTPTFAFHQHNEHKKIETVLTYLAAGQSIAIISDAGMPGISDPGFLAVRAAHQHGYPVSCIPGPSAAITALVASGLPCDRFVYEGFLPAKKGRKTKLELLAEEERTVILFESTHRIIRLLGEIDVYFGSERMIAVCRELTKKFEEVLRGTASEILKKAADHKQFKGEFVVIIAGKNYEEEKR